VNFVAVLLGLLYAMFIIYTDLDSVQAFLFFWRVMAA